MPKKKKKDKKNIWSASEFLDESTLTNVVIESWIQRSMNDYQSKMNNMQSNINFTIFVIACAQLALDIIFIALLLML